MFAFWHILFVFQMRKDTGAYCCTSERGENIWIATCIGAVIVFVILSLVVVLIGALKSPARDAIHRLCPIARPDDLMGAGEPNAIFRTVLEFNQDSNTLSYDVRSRAGISGITAILIHGPVEPLQDTGPIAFALCGGPTVACDTTTTPGVVLGEVRNTAYDGVHPNGVDLRPLTESIRAVPSRYYVEVLTNARPVSPGAAKAWLNVACGYE